MPRSFKKEKKLSNQMMTRFLAQHPNKRTCIEGVKFSTAGDIGTANIVLRQNTMKMCLMIEVILMGMMKT